MIQPGIQELATIVNQFQTSTLSKDGNTLEALEQSPLLGIVNRSIGLPDLRAFQALLEQNKGAFKDANGEVQTIAPQTAKALERLTKPGNEALFYALSNLDSSDQTSGRWDSADTQALIDTSGQKTLAALAQQGANNLFETRGKKDHEKWLTNLKNYGANGSFTNLASVSNGAAWLPITDDDTSVALLRKNMPTSPNIDNKIATTQDLTAEQAEYIKAVIATPKRSSSITTTQETTDIGNTVLNLSPNTAISVGAGLSLGGVLAGGLAWLDHRLGPELLPTRWKAPILVGLAALGGLTGYFASNNAQRTQDSTMG
jgi:hypothetical protein